MLNIRFNHLLFRTLLNLEYRQSIINLNSNLKKNDHNK